MHRIHQNLFQNYERWTHELGDISYPHSDECVNVDEVLRAHYLLCDYFSREGEPIAAAGPRDKTLLLSAVDRQIVGFGDIQKWNDVYHKAATLFFGIIKNHAFFDGNKRTGLLCALHQLIKNRRIPTGQQKEFEQLAVDTAGNRLHTYTRYSSFEKKDDPEVRVIAHFFRQHTRKEDKQLYVITFNQLRRILAKYDFQIEGPHDNLIDVIKYEQASRFFGLSRRVERRLIAQVGCPRMSAEINLKALKTVLRNAGLTPENGYDSQVVFKDADPFDYLIDKFNEPLRRLRDK